MPLTRIVSPSAPSNCSDAAGERAGLVERAVLHDEREVVDAVVAGQLQRRLLVIAHEEHAGQPRVHLRTRLLVEVRVVPQRRRGLIDRPFGMPILARRDRLVRSAVLGGREGACRASAAWWRHPDRSAGRPAPARPDPPRGSGRGSRRCSRASRFRLPARRRGAPHPRSARRPGCRPPCATPPGRHAERLGEVDAHPAAAARGRNRAEQPPQQQRQCDADRRDRREARRHGAGRRAPVRRGPGGDRRPAIGEGSRSRHASSLATKARMRHPATWRMRRGAVPRYETCVRRPPSIVAATACLAAAARTPSSGSLSHSARSAMPPGSMRAVASPVPPCVEAARAVAMSIP